MNRLILTIVAVIIIAIAALGIISLNKNSQQEPTTTVKPLTSTPQLQAVDFEASFQITTQGIIRSFKGSKYHQRSSDVYLSADNPTIVHVKKIGTTWSDFFNTLPMKLTKNCLTTGDGETFCNGSDGTLKFYLNDQEDPDLLDKEIKGGDKAQIKF